MLRAASVGLGWWSDELAGAIQGKSDKITITSCYSRSADKRAAFAGKFGCAQHDSYDALLADPAIDAVILTTPHSLHGQHVTEAAAAGKQVFVEKPFTLTAESGRDAARACRDAGVTLAVGQNRRFTTIARELKERLDAGAFGTLLHLEANFSVPSALTYTPERWRANRSESPGGALAGLSVHMIDLIAWLGGPIQQVMGQAKRRAVSVEMDDTTSALFDLESGATAYLGGLCAAPFTCFLNIYGTGANAFATFDDKALAVQLPGEEPKPVAITAADSLKAELEEFAAACAGERRFRVTPEEAIHNVAVMEAIVRSAAETRAVSVQE